MSEANGHRWEHLGSKERCRKCQMKYGYYLDIKRASQEQPKREDLKEWLRCKGVEAEGE